MKKPLWQDIAFMAGGFVFAPALVVSIVQDVRIPMANSLPTALALTMFVVCYMTLKLRLAAIATSLTAICWYILFFTAIN